MGSLPKKLSRNLPFALAALKHPITAKRVFDLWRNPGAPDPKQLRAAASGSKNAHWPASVRARVAESLYINGQFDDAFELLNQKAAMPTRMMEGWLSLFLGKTEHATRIFSALSDRPSSRYEALKNSAYALYLQGELDAAIGTVTAAIANNPARMPAITLLSRIVRNEQEIERVLGEKQRIARKGLTLASSAQLIRACGRASAWRYAEHIAADAVINLPFTADQPNAGNSATGLPKGSYTSKKGNLILRHFDEVAENSGVRFFLMGGTLLGLVRDNALLPWDKDLDFGCFVEEATIQDLWEIFSASPYFLPMGTVDDKLIKLRHVSGVTVDIFVNHKDGDLRWHGGQFVCWQDKAFNLRPLEFRGAKFYVPESAEAYLENHYGSNWRKPDPGFDVFWEAPDVFNVNEKYRYANTLAKGLQFLAGAALSGLETRLNRAAAGGAEDVAGAYRFVLNLHDEFHRRG